VIWELAIYKIGKELLWYKIIRYNWSHLSRFLNNNDHNVWQRVARWLNAYIFLIYFLFSNPDIMDSNYDIKPIFRVVLFHSKCKRLLKVNWPMILQFEAKTRRHNTYRVPAKQISFLRLWKYFALICTVTSCKHPQKLKAKTRCSLIGSLATNFEGANNYNFGTLCKDF
jgi:hypothetical protein